MADPTIRNPRRAAAIHAVRVTLVIALLMAIPSPDTAITDSGTAPMLDQLDVGPTRGLRIESTPDSNGLWRVVNADNEPVALVARTLPHAEDSVGYRGPTEASIVFDSDLAIQSVGLLSSADTEEHVDAVIQDDAFWAQFVGWSWGGPAGDVQIDAVSGATLTSLALAEGVLKRIGGARPSLVFGEPLRVDDLREWFPNATFVDTTSGIVRDELGQSIGRVLRTGPLTDDVIGYQGPTELLIALSPEGVATSIRIRQSFDNEPYVDYVRVESGFWKTFQGQTLAQLARFDPIASGVEGVSGATMTSLAIADTLVAAAKVADAEASRARAEQAERQRAHWSTARWSIAEVITVLAVLMVAVLSRLRAFHRPLVRRLWLVATVIVIGFWSGNLVSMALVAGWSAEGIAWRLAPGLAVIAIVALALPPLTKSNPYCNHLCPHGALQQLTRPSSQSRRRVRLSRRLTKWLSYLPGATLTLAYASLVLVPSLDLSSWEPFHAYLFRMAPWGAFVLAAVSLMLSAVIPMGYCRLGCPTGRLIDYLRRSATSDRMQAADLVAIGLLVMAVVVS